MFQILYTVTGPLLAFLWMTTLLTIFTFLLTSYLDVKNWQGHDSPTAHYTLAMVVILVPAIMTIITSTILKHRVHVYIPMFIPRETWDDSQFVNIFDIADYSTLFTALLVMLIMIYLITLAPFLGITREILDPETRRKSLEKKPYIRFSNIDMFHIFSSLSQVCSPHLS